MSTGGLEAGGRAVPVHASAALVLIAIHAVLAVALGGDTPTRAVVSDAIFAAALVGAGSLAVAAARSSRARARRSETGWALIASGMFLRAAATAAFAFADPYRVPPGAIEAVTGGLYLVAYAPIILGMFLMPLRLLTGAERISLALDASTVTIATGIVLVAVFGFPEQSVLAVERMRGVLIVGMLALNLALIAVLSELFLLQAYRVEPSSVLILLVSCLLNVGADVAFLARFSTGLYRPGELVDTGWLAAALLIGIAARIDSTRGRLALAPRAVRANRSAHAAMFFQHTPMFFVILLGGLVLWDHYHPVGVATDVLLWGMCAVGLLVLARLGLSGYANERLLRAVSASEERYRLIAENSSDVIWVRDLSLRLTWISPSVNRLRGIPADSAVRAGLDEILTPRSAQEARDVLRRMLDRAEREGPQSVHSESITVEMEVRRVDGSTVWTETALRFLADEEGKPRAVLGVTRDISRRRQLEDELRAANAELERRVARRTQDLHEALEDVRRLQGLLPICAGCKRIRDEDGTWAPVDEYTARRGDFLFSHGLCPECLKRYMGE